VTSKKLAQLHKELNSCRRCLDAGHFIVPRAIYAGKQSAQVIVIGQAPGVTEAKAGRPFNAGSGTRLFGWLGRAGFGEDQFRTEQYMTSVTKCFPGKAKGGGGDRVPSRKEQTLCRTFLDREIEIIDPHLIIPVGRLAIGLYFPAKTPLTEIIGSEKFVDGRVVIPLPHPSGASRWHQIEENRERISEAIERIRVIREELGI
jgi:uracil-DNA glycosylase